MIGQNVDHSIIEVQQTVVDDESHSHRRNRLRQRVEQLRFVGGVGSPPSFGEDMTTTDDHERVALDAHALEMVEKRVDRGRSDIDGRGGRSRQEHSVIVRTRHRYGSAAAPSFTRTRDHPIENVRFHSRGRVPSRTSAGRGQVVVHEIADGRNHRSRADCVASRACRLEHVVSNMSSRVTVWCRRCSPDSHRVLRHVERDADSVHGSG